MAADFLQLLTEGRHVLVFTSTSATGSDSPWTGARQLPGRGAVHVDVVLGPP
ncbi:hypothetical protein ABT213_09805 [Streptomyces sp. NPDC001674]|uniref:hypothetical protein n=1 Tax=Streptomyces sp. NPDC001674 TaxID=3154394 RepID=UPI00331E551F